jgi:hypothetical protein
MPKMNNTLSGNELKVVLLTLIRVSHGDSEELLKLISDANAGIAARERT